MTVVIVMIPRVNGGTFMMGTVVPVCVAGVTGLVGHTVVDINAWRPEDQGRQREKSKRTKAAATHK